MPTHTWRILQPGNGVQSIETLFRRSMNWEPANFTYLAKKV